MESNKWSSIFIVQKTKIQTVIALQNNIIINLTLDEVEKYKSIMKDQKKNEKSIRSGLDM